jgi:hypothetical protein
MATTTTNFGWDIPQSTDLVKDGATAIAALGQDIDTALVDLKGGTTGQILAKASNTDLDYSWVTNDVGDITEVTAGTGLTGGGTSGAVTLSFDQANFGGGQYAAGKNKIINGDFGINQRNFTSVTTNLSFGFDRFWLNTTGGTTTYTPQTFTPGAAPVVGYEATNFARLVTSGQSAASDRASLNQRIEDVRTFANQTATVSFWAKASTGTPSVSAELLQSFGSGGSSSVTAGVSKIAITSSWARYTATITVPSVSGKTIGSGSNLTLLLWTSAGSDFNSRSASLGIQNVTIDFWGVQVEAGSTASPFQTATGTIQGELAACQRYYIRFTAANSGSSMGGLGAAQNTTNGRIQFQLPVTMRIIPTSVESANTAVFDQVTITNTNAAVTLSGLDTANTALLNFPVASGLTQYRPYVGFSNGSGAGYIGLVAEL